MPSYSYKARDGVGKAVTGNMDSSSEEALAEKLRTMGYMPTLIQEAKPEMDLNRFGERFKRVKTEDLIIFSVQLANMIDAGLNIDQKLGHHF